ncbi:hypothetical protein BHE74_00016690 [Ensete ventricosum]|nr:hypothetical protein BHE74_00016690 [Ensete ventricosum]
MGSPSPLQVEDQTDEDFFDKLVDDDFGVEGSIPHSEKIARDLSNLSLGDVGTSLEGPDNAGLISESNGQQQSGSLESSEFSERGFLVSMDSMPSLSSVDQVVPLESSSVHTVGIEPQGLSTGKSDGSKGTSVKEVQWSAFSVGSQQFDNVGLDTSSDFFAQNADSLADKLKSDADLNFVPLENQNANIKPYTDSSNGQGVQLVGSATEQNWDGVDAQYWESLYPGWKYDATTGQWYQLGGYDATTNTQLNSYETSIVNSQGDFMDSAQDAVLDSNLGSSDVLFLQQTSPSVLETIAEESTINTTSSWNLGYQGSMDYPPNMIFDPQYPGWYYDTNTQQWYTVESYTQTKEMAPTVAQNEVGALADYSKGNYHICDDVGQSEQSTDGVLAGQVSGECWNHTTDSYAQQNMLQAEQMDKSRQSGVLSGNQQIGSFYGSTIPGVSYTDQNVGFRTFQPVVSRNFGSNNDTIRPQNSIHGESMYRMNHQKMAPNAHDNLSSSYPGNQIQNSVDYSQHLYQDTNASYTQFSNVPHEGRSSAGRPVHALVTFGFGGMLVVMKNSSSSGTTLDYGSQVQSLLVSGRRTEALQCAQEGQLWGPALVLAAQLGDKVRATLKGQDCPMICARCLELYEYSKVLGNSQFILLPFQPYKGGYGTSLAPANLVGKLFTSFDRSIHRMIGAPPAPLPPMPQGSVNDKEAHTVFPRVANSQSTMAMSSLVPSTSGETISEWTGDDSRKSRHNRSISEPDFGRSPKQVDFSLLLDKVEFVQVNFSDGARSKATVSGGSRFGRIGSQLLQKTMGWVSRSHHQFYYDEKLKRWMEEGADPPAEEPALPPPPTATPFQNGIPDYNINNAFKSENNINDAFQRESHTDKMGPAMTASVPLEQNSGMPPIPPSQNQFSARGRMGVRSRYVDTFNKGGGSLANSFRSPAVPSVKPLGAKFFVPNTPATVDERETDAAGKNNQDVSSGEEPPKSVIRGASFSSPSSSSSSSSMQRFPSMDHVAAPVGNKGSAAASWTGNGPLSRTRAASWSGGYPESVDQKMTGMNPMGSTTTTQAGALSSSSLQRNGGSLGEDDLHEVEL